MQILTGTVVSNKMEKTLVVEIESLQPHPKYRKMIKKTSNIKVHNDGPKVSEGSLVQIQNCRPISKGKQFKLVKVLSGKEEAEVKVEKPVVKIEKETVGKKVKADKKPVVVKKTKVKK